MAGRCTECGKYHYDGPPCDNCGEMGFTTAPKVMECAECGEVHLDGNPPCNACGEMGFRRVANPEQHLGDGGPAGLQADEDPDWASLGGSGSRRRFLYGLGLVGVLGAGYYAVSSSDDYPTTEAPGEADEAGGIRFETVETEMRGLINDERKNRGRDTLSLAGNVDAFAEYYNKEFVNRGGGELDPVDSEEFDGEFNVSDYHAVGNHWGQDVSGRSIAGFDSASDLARRTVDSWMEQERFRDPLMSAEFSEIGGDVHVGPGGDVFVLVVVD